MHRASGEGLKIKMKRIRCGMTQAEVASLLGTSTTEVSFWENNLGKRCGRNRALISAFLAMPLEILRRKDGRWKAEMEK